MSIQLSDPDPTVARFKVKKLVRSLEGSRGAGTSVITLLVPPKEQISRVTGMLTQELGACANIKSQSNRASVQSAITATMGRLKMFNRVPENGMIIYCGTVLTEDDKERKVTIDLEPFKPVSRSLYMCDNKFHTEELHRMLESDEKFGFIIVDGNGAYYYTVAGSQKTKLSSFSVELPKKHGRGGQSKNRFARIRQERRHNYVRKVAEMATQHFITNDRPNVLGIVLAGSAEFKETLFQSDLFDPRLKAVVMKLCDVAHPGDMGLNQAIEMAGDTLTGVKFVHEKKLLTQYMDEIATDSQLFSFGINDTLKCVEMGAVQTLIVYEDLEVNRYVITPSDGGAPLVTCMTAAEWVKTGYVASKTTKDGEGKELTQAVECENLVDWMAANYSKWGCVLELVSNKTAEGAQFVRGFGGVGGLLRYKVNLSQLKDLEKTGENDDDAGGDDYDVQDDFM